MDNNERWAEESKTGERERIYKGERLRSVAMAMGGIGAGQISIAGDGSLRQWEIFNIANHSAMIPNSFFAVRSSVGSSKPVTRLLQSNALYDEKIDPVPCVSDYIVPDECRRLLSELPGIKEIEFIGEYPVAELRYIDPDINVRVKLETFSPFVPLNAKDSGLPAIIFNFSIENPNDKDAEVSIAASLQNAVGYDGIGKIDGTRFSDYGGNVNKVIKTDAYTAIKMENLYIPKDHPSNGTMALISKSPNVTYLADWKELDEFWNDFSSDGKLENIWESSISPKGETRNAALAAQILLKPKETKTITFIIVWHFPNHYVNWGQKCFGIPEEKSLFWMGNAYGAWFSDAIEVAEYVIAKIERLTKETRLFRDTFYDSTLPYWLLDCVTSQISTIRSPTCLWNEDGTFHAFEGCCGESTSAHHINAWGGCCPLNCTHVWNYEMTLAKLFPELERTMRYTDLIVQMDELGGIPHRTVIPAYLPRYKAPEAVAADGQFGTVLKTYREYLQSGDSAFLNKVWPRIKRAMAYALERWDDDQDGICDGAQWNTYDCFLYGKNTFITSLFLAALLATAEMADEMGEPDLARACRERAYAGSKNADRELYNGEYYIQIYDADKYKEQQYGSGCHADQLLGQWWAHQLNLGYVLPEEHVKSALRAIYKYNFRQNFKGFKQQPRIFASEHDKGLLICTWPSGGRPEIPTNYSDEVWTGIEYSTAALMIREGLVDEGLQIAKAARDRYDGTERNPWNEVECGDHYARPMSSWSLLESVCGWAYNATKSSITIAPKLSPDNFKAFFITSKGWGTISQKKDGNLLIAKLACAWGEVTVKELKIASPNKTQPNDIKATICDKNAEVEWVLADGFTVISFTIPIVLTSGCELELLIG